MRKIDIRFSKKIIKEEIKTTDFRIKANLMRETVSSDLQMFFH